jgi:CelD/BcsL family acetyltransferase involved in cellulose biosynthesis
MTAAGAASESVPSGTSRHAGTTASVASDAAAYTVSASLVQRLDEALARDIDTLADRAAEPNVFYESWMLGPALEHLDVPALTLVCVRDRDGALTGLFPLQSSRRFRGLPLRSLRSWEHDYLFLDSPLVAADQVQETIGALLDWLASARAPASVLDLVSVRADGPIAHALLAETRRRPRFRMLASLRERALLDLRAPATGGISGKHRKELRRQERRLAELGRLAYRVLAGDEDATPWIGRFLALEAAGWKGSDGTALAAREGSRAFFESAALRAHERGRLQMFEMTLDDATIATKCNFVGGDGAFMFKIAYDESHAKYSPGLLLELFNMHALESAPGPLAWVDSCAKSEHFMIERLWSDRRQLGDYSICGRGLIARTIIGHGERIRRLRRSLRAYLRRT